MTTNVTAKELNYDSYKTEKYDSDIVRSIPWYIRLHKKIMEILTDCYKSFKGDRIKNVLELGVGTGLTSEKIFKIIPKVHLVAVDFSKTMLDGARKRLSGYDVKYIEGDYSELNFRTNLGTNFDIVMSVIGIHHQNDFGKKELFKKIYDCLNDDGIFIFGDLVTFKDKREAERNDKRHHEYLILNAEDEKSLKEWVHHHKFLNLLAPVEDQIEWLKEAGFSSVEIKFKKYNTCLILAKK